MGCWTCVQEKIANETEHTPPPSKKAKQADKSSEKQSKGLEQKQAKPAPKKKARQEAAEVSLEVNDAARDDAERDQQTTSPNKKKKNKQSTPSPNMSEASTVPATHEELLARGMMLSPSPVPQRIQEVCRDMRDLVDGMSMEDICKHFECTEEDAREVLDMVKTLDSVDQSPEAQKASDTQGTSWS